MICWLLEKTNTKYILPCSPTLLPPSKVFKWEFCLFRLSILSPTLYRNCFFFQDKIFQCYWLTSSSLNCKMNQLKSVVTHFHNLHISSFMSNCLELRINDALQIKAQKSKHDILMLWWVHLYPYVLQIFWPMTTVFFCCESVVE